MVSNPDDVKAVFTGDPRLLHAGEANRILLPILGEHSLLLLDGAEHMAQRKLMLPPFHGARMQSYRALMADIAGTEIARWPSGDADPGPSADAGGDARDHPPRGVRARRTGSGWPSSACELRRVLDRLTNPRWVAFLIALGPERIPRFPPFAREMARVDRLIYERDRGAAGRTAAPMQRDGHPVDAARRRARGRLGDERPPAARRAADAAGRRPRDDRDRARLGGRAARPPPRQARAARRRDAGRRGSVPEGGRIRDAAAAPRDLARQPHAQGADAARRIRPPGRRQGRAVDLPRPPPARRLPRARALPARAVPRQRRPGRTRGSRSAAASAAASAARSRSSRWRSSCASSPAGARSIRRGARPSASTAARSPRPRGTTPR